MTVQRSTGTLRRLLLPTGLVVTMIMALHVSVIESASAAETTVDTGPELAQAFSNASGDDYRVIVNADITIGSGGPQVMVPEDESVTLDLAGYSVDVTGASSGDAGIGVPVNAALTITDSGANGNLLARSTGGGAGIGGGNLDPGGGAVTITGGTVTATSADSGAGIGGGNLGAGGPVTITDGTVIATSGGGGAGIGGGNTGVGGTVTISGGTVTATGGDYAAGIGGGNTGASGTVTISGGTVTATGGEGGAGIGGGTGGDSRPVTISGDSSVEATGGVFGAGIGGGLNGNGGLVIIRDGSVTATGGDYAAGIGGGRIGAGGAVTIHSTAVVTAATGNTSGSASAIGSGNNDASFGLLENAGTLQIPEASTLRIPDNATATNTGTIQLKGTLANAGTVDNQGTIINTGTVDNPDNVHAHNTLISFDLNGGSGPAPSDIRVYAATLADAELELPTEKPTRDGYNFIGWYPTPDANGDPITNATPISTDSGPEALTLHAGWAALPAIDTTTLPTGQVDTDYAATLTATGGTGPYTWEITNGDLPAGLELSPTGTITGTPTESGTHEFTITITDQQGETDAATLAIEVQPELVLTIEDLPGGRVEVPYDTNLSATGGDDGPYTWEITEGSLPAGLHLTPNGTITGTPTEPGTHEFTITVADQHGGTDTATRTITIDPELVVTTQNLPDGVVGQPYQANLSATGGDGGPYSWALTDGSLPAGLTLHANGTIDGTPSKAGDYEFTLAVNDPAYATLTITITAPPAPAPPPENPVLPETGGNATLLPLGILGLLTVTIGAAALTSRRHQTSPTKRDHRG